MNRLFPEHEVRTSRCLSGPWKFRADPQDVGEQEQWHRGLVNAETVTVPSVWNTDLYMLNYDGAAWYEKKFRTQGGTLRFEFESVMSFADVWLDGNHITSHLGAFTRFEAIVHDVDAGEHTLTVRADSRLDEHALPMPRTDWYHYGGIARDVFMDELRGVCILGHHVVYTLSDDLSSADIHSEMTLYNADDQEKTAPVTVKIGDHVLYTASVTVPARSRMQYVTEKVPFSGFELWSPENPRLYDVCALTDTDDLRDRVGFRLIETKDGEILLNGKPLELRGVNRHEDHPDWGMAFPPRMMKKDLDLIQDLGCNTVRGSHYPQTRMLVDMMDERGLLFWSEIPMWGALMSEEDLSDPIRVERGLAIHQEMTRDYYNHPSVIIWGMHNEIWAPFPCTYEISRRYAAHLRAHGGNRLITHASNSPFDNSKMEWADHNTDFDDIISINLYHGWYSGRFTDWDDLVAGLDEHRKALGHPQKPIVMSEFGAGALADFHSPFDSQRWSEEYQSELLSHCLNLFHSARCIKGFYIWQFCNVRTSPSVDLNRVRNYNNKGILDERRNPKAAYFKVRELYRKFAEENK